MSSVALPPPATLRNRISEIAVVAAVVFVVALLVLPVPGAMLDVLLAASIAASLLVLLVALYTTDALDFSVFPTILLLLTLFRLALNVSTTRMILGQGRAGDVIQAFGQFVVGGNYVVGIILFLILVVINFVVITKGAGRVAEVAARFTLDAMPGRQMSIDADLSAGLIDDGEARRRRREINRQADFYGAMDGAAKFVRGDAIAGLIITAINIIGGLLIGTMQRGLTFSAAASQYTVLTVGDGLVSQIPALIVSTAAGVMVTYSAGGTQLGSAVVTQFAKEPRAMWLSAGFLAVMAIVPGLPVVPFLALAGVAALGGEASRRMAVAEAQAETVTSTAVEKAPAEDTTGIEDLLQVDPVELEVGYGLIPLVDERHGGDLLERIKMLRRQAAQEMGILVPRIRIRDDLRLGANEYTLRLRGSEVARGEAMPRMMLALDTGSVAHTVDGVPTEDPSFGMPGVWIAPEQQAEADAAGYVVVDPATVISTHLMETLKVNAADLLGRQEVQEMVDALKKTYPALIEEIVPAKVSIGTLHRVLQRLLRERVPIRDLVTILEAAADLAETTKDPEAITEHVRRSLGKAIAEQYAGESGSIRGIVLAPRLEALLMNFFSPRQSKPGGPVPSPDQLTDLLRRLDRMMQDHGRDGNPVALVTSPALRVGVRRLLEPVLPAVAVLSLAELPPYVNLETVATWDIDERNQDHPRN